MILTVDIGGTKTLVARFDENGTIIAEKRFITSQDYDEFFHELSVTIQEIWQPEIRVITVAAPGTIGYKDGTIIKLGNLHWHNVPIVDQLHQAFNVPVTLENDANAGALAAVAALPNPPELALYVTIGTGIGTGVISNGAIDTALAQSEGGHMVLNYKNKLCIWESFASGHAIYQDFHTYAYAITDPAIWQQIAERIGLGLLALIPALQPNTVIIGGGIGAHFDNYREGLIAYIKQYLPEMITMPHIIQANNPEKAVIYGCYQLARQALTTR
jgi:predicted NBD/HSP70 family sugar kinase